MGNKPRVLPAGFHKEPLGMDACRDFPESDKLYDQYTTKPLLEPRFFKTGVHKRPEFPASEDYRQFCDLTGLTPSLGRTLMLFRETFDVDGEGRIVGVKNNYEDPSLHWSGDEYLTPLIGCSFRMLPAEEMAEKYDKLAPWADRVRRQHPPKKCSSRLVSNVFSIMLAVNAYRFFYMDLLVSEAIKYNYKEDDPDRARLLQHVNLESDGTPSEALMWYEESMDFSTTFDPEVLETLKPILEAYLRDLKSYEARK